ncbi:flagellar biosynthetic protein FlhB [Planctomycetales bacterium]|nr:flagellar biosynthetic protein FlhB [Planctomycetales bacterium]
MPSEGGEKTQEPTPKRLEEAREKGNVAKSSDLASAFVLFFGIVLLMTVGKQVATDLYIYSINLYGDPLFLIPENEGDENLRQSAVALFRETIVKFLKPLSLFFILLAVIGVAANVFQTGLMFLPNKLAPDLNNLNPMKGIQRIFSMQSVMRLAMGIVKIAIAGAVAWYAVEGDIGQILNLTANDENQITSFLVWTLLMVSLKVAAAFVIIALIDYMYQKWKHHQDMMMTVEEVREEVKQMIGDPKILGKRRQIQREMAMKQRVQGTSDADVVVTNPTHFAVAIKFDAKTMDGPTVVAKGADYVAFRIRELAKEHNIPVFERKPLARALYFNVELGEKITLIPEHMKSLVEVIKYAYKLSGRDFDKEYVQRQRQRKAA